MTARSAHDLPLEIAYRRALQGDQAAGRFVLIYLQNAVRGTGGVVLSDLARTVLADMLLAIINGMDARAATFTKTGSGNPKWRNQARDQRIVGEMNWRIMQDMKPWPAAGEVATLFGLQQKTVNNIWLKRRHDPDIVPVFIQD